MKKVISLLLVCMMMLSMVTVVSAVEVATTFTVASNVDATRVEDGGTISVPITVSGIPEGKGYYVVQFFVEYDATKLDFVEYTGTSTKTGGNVWFKSVNMALPSSWGTGENEVNEGVGTNNILFVDSTMGMMFQAESLPTGSVILNLDFTKVPGATGTAYVKLTDVKVSEGSTGSQVDYQLSTGYTAVVNGSVLLSAPTLYDVTAPSSEAGKYTVAGIESGKVNKNTALNFTVTPEVGYEVVVKAGDETLVGTDNAYTYTVIGNTTISVTAKKKDYTITKGAGSAGGTFDVAETAQYGDTVTITATPASEYFTPVYSVVETDGGSTVEVDVDDVDGNTATFTMPAEGVTVDVTFDEIPTNAITVDGGITNGTVTVSKALAAEGEEIIITTAPAAGYTLETLTVTAEGEEPADVKAASKFTMPEKAVTVNATFAEILYAINVEENIENGTVSHTKGEGNTIILSNEPDTGYVLDLYTVTTVADGTPVEVVDGKFQLTEDVNVTATFIKVDYDITPSPNDHFVVTGLVDVAQYEDKVVFTVNPAIGYEVAVSIEGVDIDKNDNAYSFVMPAHAVAINIVASLIDYNITVDADDNALVTAPATANYADEVNITADAVVGYVVKSVEVKDAEDATVEVTDEGAGVYSFTMPDKDVTINVITELDPKYDGRITSLKVNNKPITVADDVYNYTVTLNTYAQQVQFNIVTVADDVTVDGVAAVAGESGKTVTLDVYGTQTYTIVVTPELGETWTYTVVVTNGTQSTGRPLSAATGGTTGTTLSDVKNNVSAKLDKATDNLNKDEYSEEAWAEIEKLIEDAKADLENAKNVKAAEKIEKELLEAIEAVKTLEEEVEEQIPVDETIEPTVIAAPEKTEEELAAAEALYSDMEDHWSLAYVHELSVVNNVFKGNEDGTFAPDKGISRQEIAVALGRLLGLEEIAAEVTATDFTDDAEIADWAKGYVAIMNELGLIKGNADGSFAANDVITREQLALILSRMIEAPEAVAGMAFDDADAISDWAVEGCSVAYTFGIIKGYPDNTFKGSNTVTRAEAVVMIYNYLAAIAE